MEQPVGFLGLGVMGQPMAGNLVRAGIPLVVWSRTSANCDAACAAGAVRAQSVDEVFDRCRTVIMMLATDAVIDTVLGRGTPQFRQYVSGHTIVQMGTTAPAYSAGLAADVEAAGGRYVEAPVSGSRIPAENGELVAMVAGADDAVEQVRPLLRPMCREIVACGAVPGALTMKLAVNLYLVTMVAALAEATHFAAELGVDMDAFVAVLDAGPMASAVSRIKAAKLRARDFGVQAAIHDVRKNSRLVVDAARANGVAAPIVELADQLYLETLELGHGAEDMAAVVRALEKRTAATTVEAAAAARVN
jgi:3-hydroxyisobutyrate dehydrogenase